MYAGKVSLQDCIDVFKSKPSISEYVVIDATANDAQFNLAYKGNFLHHLGGEYYKVKRIVAENLNLKIISDYPIIMK